MVNQGRELLGEYRLLNVRQTRQLSKTLLKNLNCVTIANPAFNRVVPGGEPICVRRALRLDVCLSDLGSKVDQRNDHSNCPENFRNC